ncbi:MAG: FecR domain-containing protein [Nitrospinaceae bacterium]|jgi:hypothetical protein|nr:MAG: FecR domain-containing protein [Nitrospinaceae bacterium]
MNTPPRHKIPGSPVSASPLWAGVLLLLMVFAHPVFAKEDRITRGEFVQMMAKHNPENVLLPKNHGDLSTSELYMQIVEALKIRGFNVLEGKADTDPLNTQEFVRITYAFTGQPAGTSLFEQKLYLKRAGIIKSADIGLATGVEGKVLQFHKGDISGNRVELASPLFADDRITNGENAKSSFTFDDGSVLTLGEDAVVNISKHIYDPEKDFRQMVINVSMGAVKFVVTKAREKNSMFKVVTPTVTASVRGTEFVVMVGPKGETTVVGIEGSIETAPILPDGSEGQRNLLSAGETQEVSPNGVASEVKKAPLHVISTAKEKTADPKNTAPDEGITRAQAKDAARATQSLSRKPAPKEKDNGAPPSDPTNTPEPLKTPGTASKGVI